MAHFFMPAATSSAILRSSGAPLSMASISALYTLLGRYLNIFSLLNTYLAKYSEGRSAGVATSTAFFLKAVSTTLNLSFDIIPNLICC